VGLRDMYAYAIQTAKGKFHGNAEERDGKLHFKGTVATEAEKNEIWTAITGGPAAAGAAAATTGKTYTVKAGDTLGAIAKEHLGNASAYTQIFELNKDQLTDPNKIKPGQVLRLP